MTERTTQSREVIVRAITEVLGNRLGVEDVEAIVNATLRPGKQLNMLADFLEEHHDGLMSGSSSAPPGITTLVEALRFGGFDQFQLPRCASCATTKPLRYQTDSGRICTACFTRSRALQCSRCGLTRPVTTRDTRGPVCHNCWRKDPTKLEECVVCGERGQVAIRSTLGPTCMRCYERPASLCEGCGRHAPIHSRRTGKALCDSCYRSPRRVCSACGEEAVINRRGDTPESGNLCARCYEYPRVTCSSCGRVRRVSQRTVAGPLCQTCAVRPTRICTVCARERPVQALTDDGPLCSTCYSERHLVECKRCGTVARPYESGRCARCVLDDRLRAALGGDQFDERLEPVRAALLEGPNPEASLRWLARSHGALVLIQIARGEVELSHEGLGSLEQTKPLNHLRGLLIASGVLSQDMGGFERLEPWLDDLLKDVRSDKAQLVRAFAVWHVFRRARRKAQRGRLTEGGVKWARLRVQQSLKFLDWLEAHGKELSDLTQADMDLWLASGSVTRYVVRDFISWARARRLIDPVRVPLRQSRSATVQLAEDVRWGQVKSLLESDGVDLAVRVAGLFVLLFGQHLTRVVRLRTSAVQVSGGSVAVVFASEPVTVPPGLDTLVMDLCDRRGHAVVNRGDWLFQGGIPGRPITAEQLRLRLAEHDIVLRPTRNGALMQLASQVPASVLADLLGLHTNTAVEWVRNSRGDWSRYAAQGAQRSQRSAISSA
jgi:hypothetical protein